MPTGLQVRRLNGDPLDDRLENLAYGTREQVDADHAARARREEVAGAATHCPRGHPYSDSWLGDYGERRCTVCAPGRPVQKAPRTAPPLAQRSRRRTPHVNVTKPTVTSCIDCGTSVAQATTPGPIFLRCPECRREEQRAANRRYRLRNPAPQAAPRQASCVDCDVQLVPKTGTGPVRRRCDDCRRDAARAAHRRHRRRKAAAKNASPLHPAAEDVAALTP